jgi:hypothetical protein
MLEDGMLATAEGALVCVSLDVEPQRLESMLEALALVNFPINPQIYHDAAMVYRFADGREVSEALTLVEFPAYEGHLAMVRATIQACGFAPSCVHVRAMLEDIQTLGPAEAAPAGAPYVSRRRIKRRN